MWLTALLRRICLIFVLRISHFWKLILRDSFADSLRLNWFLKEVVWCPDAWLDGFFWIPQNSLQNSPLRVSTLSDFGILMDLQRCLRNLREPQWIVKEQDSYGFLWILVDSCGCWEIWWMLMLRRRKWRKRVAGQNDLSRAKVLTPFSPGK